MPENTVDERAARRRRTVKRLVVVAAVVVAASLAFRACQGDRPYVASADGAAQQDERTVSAVNAFMQATGGVSQWKDYYDEGKSRPEPFRTLTGTSVCSNRNVAGFTTADVGSRREVNLSTTSKVTPRNVLNAADTVLAKYDITRRGEDRGRSSWAKVTYSGGSTGPVIYISYYGDNPDAKVNMLVLAASVCRSFPE